MGRSGSESRHAFGLRSDSWRPRKSLIVDDDPTMRMVIAEALQAAGYWDCVMSADGQHAQQMYLEHRREIGLISCDCYMPEVDGVEFTEFLGRHEATCPIIFVSGAHSSLRDGAVGLARAHDLNVVGCLEKPLKADTIIALARQSAASEGLKQRLGREARPLRWNAAC